MAFGFSPAAAIIHLRGSGWVAGGPPGLQIRSAGANHVRGGFDSHTFPPFFRHRDPVSGRDGGLSLFEGKLKIHLSMEDRRLYPQLANRGSKNVRSLAGDYIREMGGIYDRFNAFVQRWKYDPPAEDLPAVFAAKTREIMGVIHARIRGEEEFLFPLPEQSGSNLSEEE